MSDSWRRERKAYLVVETRDKLQLGPVGWVSQDFEGELKTSQDDGLEHINFHLALGTPCRHLTDLGHQVLLLVGNRQEVRVFGVLVFQTETAFVVLPIELVSGLHD